MTAAIRSLAAIMAALVMAGAVADAAQDKPAAGANSVSVTVKYTGKQPVDARHRIWVWLFTSPDIDATSIPIAEQSLDTNGGTARFTAVTAKQVYVVAAFDENGGFGGSAPPPPGSPIAYYGAKGAEDGPAPVVPGAKASLTVTLSDARRWR